ncbi:MAG: histidine kinase dimerization/phosphoacceptor domain -containing protein [Candidatus Omnitrophota bacterium]
MRKEGRAKDYYNILFGAGICSLLIIFFGERLYIFFSKSDMSWLLVHPQHLWFDLSAITLLSFSGVWLLVLNRQLHLRTKDLQKELIRRSFVEEALRSQGDLAQRYLDVAGVMLIIINSEGVVTSINKKGCDILGCKEEEVLGKDWFENFLPKNIRAEIKSIFGKLINGVMEPVEYVENPIITKDGQEKIIAWHNSILADKRGKYFVVASGEDITQRRCHEVRLKQALCEKDVLLREVHHRVKNNLLILYGLIAFQQKILENEKGAKEALETVKQRIQAISLVHKLLYHLESYTQIDFSEYIKLLSNELTKAYVPSEKKIDLKLDLGLVTLNLDEAVACGLIVNELMLNAFKYAFAGRERGVVRVILKSKGDLRELSVCDDGIGMPEELVCEESKTLGMRLIFMLVRQLKGCLEYKKNNGSVFTVIFRQDSVNKTA